MTGGAPIDEGRVTDWLTANSPLRPPLTIDLIAAGGSNVTFRVTDAEGLTVALRRPPVGARLASAHDIDREWRILSALAESPSVPVPTPIARCDDESVTGAPFYAMEFVEGPVWRSSADTASVRSDDAERATRSLVATHCAIHSLDLDRVGLTDLGRHEHYVQRQLRRWMRQVDEAGVRPLPRLAEVHDRLIESVPDQRLPSGLVHGDYRFDNTVLDPRHEIGAVLDWELATIGDPLADIAWSLQYWADPDDALTFLPDAPTAAAVFPRRADVIALYAETLALDMSDFDFYVAFSWWKQAAIVEGAYARRLAGSVGGMAGSGDVHAIARRADSMLEHADHLTRSL